MLNFSIRFSIFAAIVILKKKLLNKLIDVEIFVFSSQMLRETWKYIIVGLINSLPNVFKDAYLVADINRKIN